MFVFHKRNLTVGEQPTIIRYDYSAQVEDIVLTITGTALPAGYSLKASSCTKSLRPKRRTTSGKPPSKLRTSVPLPSLAWASRAPRLQAYYPKDAFHVGRRLFFFAYRLPYPAGG